MDDYSLPKSLVISGDVIFQEIEGESVLLNLKTEQYFGLDEVGTRFWLSISEDANTENAIRGILANFDVNEETLKADLASLTAELIGQGLVSTKE